MQKTPDHGMTRGQSLPKCPIIYHLSSIVYSLPVYSGTLWVTVYCLLNMHFTRIEPIVGTTLRHLQVAILGLPFATPIVQYLAACGVGNWLWDGEPAAQSVLYDQLKQKHGDALNVRYQAFNHQPCDLVIGVGHAANQAAWQFVQRLTIPAVLIYPPTANTACAMRVVLPDDDTQQTAAFLQRHATATPIHQQAWRTSAFLGAGIARAVLLRNTPFARHDLAQRWHDQQRELYLDAPDQPLAVWTNDPSPQKTFISPSIRRGRVMLVGLGSLGSVVAYELAPFVNQATLLDGDIVEATNPVRQAFHLAEIGQNKAVALARGLLAGGVPQTSAIAESSRDEAQISHIVNQHQPNVVVIATGTNADFAFARVCRAANTPHIVARCYPRARYWEAIVVDGAQGPSLSDIRGRVIFGDEPEPTPEQRAAYSDAGALEAEPATLIESGWAAAWVARLARQLLLPEGLRERWLLELLAQQRTCLLGGVGVEPSEHGSAYGITEPGQIRALGVVEIK